MFNKKGPRDTTRKTEAGPALIFLPPYLRVLFQSRPAPDAMTPPEHHPLPPYTGLADFLSEFEKTPPPDRILGETTQQKKSRLAREKSEAHKQELAKLIENYKPKEQPFKSDAYKTLFIFKLSYKTDEDKLKEVFSKYGAVVSVVIVKDRENKSRGYAFVEFSSEEEFKKAYECTNGIKIDGKRIGVDVERGRTVKGWLPLRLGGGKSTSREMREKKVRRRRSHSRDGDRRSHRHSKSRSRSRSRSRHNRERREEYRSRGDRKDRRDRDDRRNRSRSRDRRDRDREHSRHHH